MIDKHLEESKNWGPSTNTFRSVMIVNKYKRRALDLGCGSFRNSKLLLNSGFIIDAIDKNPDVKKFTELFKQRPKEYFNLIIDNYLNIDLGKNKYDIVIAQNTLSFNSKKEIIILINKIYNTLKKGGVFAGNLYGLRDFRSQKDNMSFFTKKEIEKLLVKFDIKYISDEMGDMEKWGEKVQWNSFEFVVTKK